MIGPRPVAPTTMTSASCSSAAAQQARRPVGRRPAPAARRPPGRPQPTVASALRPSARRRLATARRRSPVTPPTDRRRAVPEHDHERPLERGRRCAVGGAQRGDSDAVLAVVARRSHRRRAIERARRRGSAVRASGGAGAPPVGRRRGIDRVGLAPGRTRGRACSTRYISGMPGEQRAEAEPQHRARRRASSPADRCSRSRSCP